MKIQTNKLLLWIFIIAYLFYFGLVSVMKFNSFGFYDFDLAVHDLSVWNILRGSIFNSILGIPFLGNHMHLILFLIAPIYVIFSHPITLLLLQTIALGMGALLLYRLASCQLDGNWALIISIIYLFYPALGYTNLFEFHPTVFATFFLIMTFYYYELRLFPKFVIFMALSMLCQENIPLAVIMFGLLAIFNHRQSKWIVVPILSGSFYFLAAVLLMAYFNNNTIQFITIYRHLGNSPLEIISNILIHPPLLLKTLMRKECLTYLIHIFMPLSFLPLLSPLTLLPALPFFFQHLFSSRLSDLSIFYHYTAELIPFIFVSFIYAIRFLLKNKLLKTYQVFLKISLLFVLFLSNVFLGPHLMVWSRLFSVYRKDYLDVYKDKFITQIPAEASVVATFEFLPHLSHRHSLYSLHHVYMGFYTLSNIKYELPDNVEYALIDFNDPLTFIGFYRPYNYKNLQKILSKGDLQVQDFLDTIVLFKKNISTKQELCQIIQNPSLELENKIQANIEDDIELMGYNLNSHNNSDILDIVFYWRCLRPTQKDINIFLDIVDANDRIIMRKSRPICYRIFPTNSWQEGQILKDKCRILIPSDIFEKKYKLKVGFFDYRNELLCKVSGTVDNLGRISLMDKNE